MMHEHYVVHTLLEVGDGKTMQNGDEGKEAAVLKDMLSGLNAAVIPACRYYRATRVCLPSLGYLLRQVRAAIIIFFNCWKGRRGQDILA
jgi:hypothetical protein